MKSKIQLVYTTLALFWVPLGGGATQATYFQDSAAIAGVNAQPATPSVQSPSVQSLSGDRIQETVQKLVQFGPRVAGTASAQQASQFLVDEYRKAGYQAEIQTFTYAKFRDLGSSIRINGQAIAGEAMNNSIAGQMTARVVAVPGVGKPIDYATISVKGAIAVVKRGEIPFSQKAENAANAGAIGLVVVNSQDGSLQGTLGSPATIPVLGLSKREGELLLKPQPTLSATLAVNTQRQTITGRNVIAHLPGVTQPRVLLGAHYDSVPGSPGANDNASGTAVVLEAARQLATTPTGRQVWFMAFDGEEDGLQGSRAFVNSAPPEFLPGLTAMFNFDMVGINDRLLIGGSDQLRAQVKQLGSTALDSFSDRSDHASFAAKGVPVLFFYRGSDPNYHSPRDRITAPNALNNTVQAALKSLYQTLNLD
jgi:aminopeptidase YwaD